MRTPLLHGMAALPGPYLTVCVDFREHSEEHHRVIDLRWAALLDQARAAGADDDTIAAVDAVIAERSQSGTLDSLLIVAAHGQVILVQPIVGEVLHAAYAPVPMILPALVAMPEPVTVVVAVVDRKRAEIHVPVQGELREEVERIEGETSLPVHKARPRGRSRHRFQERVDGAWLANAKTMAPAIVAAADEVDADLIVIAGDVRERNLVRQEVDVLTPRAIVVIEEGSLARGADDEPLDRRIQELTHEYREQEMAQIAERFGAAAAQAEPLAVEELGALVSAAQKGQIETLLVDPLAPPPDQVWVSGDGQVIGRDEAEVFALGGADPRAVPAVDALIHATVAQSGEVIVTAAPLAVRLGALLRFSDRSTALSARGRD